MTAIVRIRVSGSLATALSDLVAEARRDIGWTQAALAGRTGLSRQKVSRLEHGDADIDALSRAIGAMGLRCTIEIEGRHVDERRLQRDLVHAALIAAVARRLRRAGWEVETEVPTGSIAPTGWIDVLAFRRHDGALLVVEIKSRLDDVGAVQRQVSFYEREARWAARRLGWRPLIVRVALLCLDTSEVADAILRNRELLAGAFAGDPAGLAAWIRDASATPPETRTLAAIDLARRRGMGLGLTPLSGRRSPPRHAGYASVAAELSRRRPAGRPRTRPRPARSRPP